MHVLWGGRWGNLILNVWVCLCGCISVCILWLRGSFHSKRDWEGSQGQIITVSKSCQLYTQRESRSEFCIEKVKREGYCVFVCVAKEGNYHCFPTLTPFPLKKRQPSCVKLMLKEIIWHFGKYASFLRVRWEDRYYYHTITATAGRWLLSLAQRLETR